jgi:hypothetical protein
VIGLLAGGVAWLRQQEITVARAVADHVNTAPTTIRQEDEMSQSEATTGKGSQPGPKSVTIIVNGQEKVVDKDEFSFEELVSIAHDGEPPTGENWFFTVSFRRGQGNKPEGSLLEGEEIKVKDGMIFNVTSTDKS